MPDREKVIMGLDCLITNEVPCDECPYYGSGYCTKNIAADALALLREQEAVEPIKTLDGNGNLWRDCGKCGGVLPKDAQYCPTCGRKVKWDAQ